MDVSFTTEVKLVSQGANNVNLMALRPATGVPVARLFANAKQKLALKIGTATPLVSKTFLSKNVWHNLRLQVHVAGSTSQTEVWLDGAPISALRTTASLGTAPVTKVEIGDSLKNRAFTVRFDDVSVQEVTTNDPVIAAAGDIACVPGATVTASTCRQMATSDLLVNRSLARVLTLGDNQYNNASLYDFTNSYDPSWGRVKGITSPSVGNHEYLTVDAAGYFDYFGTAAGDRTKGYYSFDVGNWHLIALNSNCAVLADRFGDGCAEGTLQNDWLEDDLLTHQGTTCTLAYWHHPRFSSGGHGDSVDVKPFWDDLYAGGADVVLSGHSHNYERFAPMDPEGAADTTSGIREFVVGTGGKSHVVTTTPPRATSEVLNFDTFGVLELTLHPDSYDWNFAAESGATFTDSGSGTCH